MGNLQDISDRYEIEALRGECSDAAMMRDYDRFASLFTQDGAWRIPDANVEFVSRDEIRAGIERAQAFWAYFVQTTHPGTIRLEGDIAVGRAYVSEFGRFRDGSSQMMYAIYHDRYQRTSEAGNSRSASMRSDTSTPLRWRATAGITETPS